MRRLLIACLATLTALIAASGSAGAATQVGHTLTPVGLCNNGITWLQPQDSAPSDGVITRWDYQAAASNAPQLKFKVGRHVTGSTYSIVGESGVVSPAPGTLNHFPIRIPVRRGDLLGFYTVTGGGCDQSNPFFTELTATADVAPGTQGSFTAEMDFSNYEMDVSASLEPDADHDGFGDETQDQCPTNGTTQGPCPVTPGTPVTSKCKHKKKKHKSAVSAKKKCKKHKKHH
jgi:hypothetical protein